MTTVRARLGGRGGVPAATLSLVASRAATGLATLAATPVLFSRLGPTGFGLWTVLLGGAAIATYADAGLGSTLLREISRAHSAETVRRARGALGLALVIPTVVGVLLAAAVLLGWPALASGLRLGTLAAPARGAALILIAAIVVDGWGLAGRAALEGTGRIPWAAGVTAATAVLTAVLGVFAVLDRDGLVGLALATLTGAAIRAGLLTLLARRATPHLTPRLGLLSRADLKALTRYGAAVQVSQAGGAVNGESDRLIVSGIGSVAAAGGLDLGLKLGNLLGVVPFCLLYSLFPSLAALAAEGNRDALDAVYVRASRLVGAAALVPAALLCACAPSVVTLWIGHPVPFAASCVLVLAPALAVVSLTGVATAVCRAEGMPGRETRFTVATAILNVVLTIALASAVGRIGVPAGTAVAGLLGSAGFLAYFHRVTRRPLAMLWRALATPVVAALVGAAAAMLAGLLTAPAGDRVQASVAVVTAGLAGLVAAAVTMAVLLRLAAARSAVDRAAGDDDGTAWVIYLSAIPWSGRRNRQHELAAQLARGRRVLFVEAPGLRPAWRLRIGPVGGWIWRVAPVALLPLGRHLPWVNRVNRVYVGWRLRRWLDRHPGPRIVILDEDLAAPLARRLGAKLCVYDAADLDWTFTRRWNRRHLRSALAAGVEAADLVMASSTVLADYLPPARGPVVELPNACDAGHFTSEVEVPVAVRALPEPRIGYVGSLDERAFDADLVATVAEGHPEWSFVLAGPVHHRVRTRLAQLTNVHLLGPVAYEDLPGLLGGFDVCLIPYRVGGRIDYVQPKKLFEYLAAGKPVVATPLPALRRLPAPQRLARTPDDFAAAIAEALQERGVAVEQARRECALSHTWDVRGRELRRLLDALEATA